MAVTKYLSNNGMIIGESTGSTNRAYGVDALGSVVATYTGTSVENTYQYKPYGAVLAKTGTAADPSFLRNGGSGFRATKLTNLEYYVRARHYSSTGANWSSADAEWPGQAAYGYCSGNPVSCFDPFGLGGCSGPPPTPGCVPLPISGPDIIQTANQQTLEFSVPGVPKCTVNFLDYVGIYFRVTVKSQSVPTGGPCTFLWEEKWKVDGARELRQGHEVL